MRSTAHVHHITQVGATDHTIVTKLNKTIVKENTKRIKNSVLAGQVDFALCMKTSARTQMNLNKSKIVNPDIHLAFRYLALPYILCIHFTSFEKVPKQWTFTMITSFIK